MGKEKVNFAAIIQEAGSSRKNKTGFWRTLKPKRIEEKCTKCRLCVDYCPDGAIKIRNGKIKIDYDYCKGCGICAEECPARAIIMIKEEK